MTPEQFLTQVRKSAPAPVYLFLGPELYYRDLCRRALLDHHLAPADREDGLVRFDLDRVSLAAVIDDARSLSLFTARRVIWAGAAEEAGDGAGEELARYVKDPTPGVVLIFDARRFDFEGDDKTKIERVRKSFASIPAHVEFRPMGARAVSKLALNLAAEAGIEIGQAEIDLLVEATAEDATRVAVEIEKLRLFKGGGGRVTAADIAALVPSAQAANIFEMVGAIGRGDRAAALDALETLVREGEYLPLALTFLSTQFRQSLASREQGLKSAAQIQAWFTGAGVAMWPSRAAQIQQTLARFTGPELAGCVRRVFAADRALRDTRPDDRIIMEEFVLDVTRK